MSVVRNVVVLSIFTVFFFYKMVAKILLKYLAPCLPIYGSWSCVVIKPKNAIYFIEFNLIIFMKKKSFVEQKLSIVLPPSSDAIVFRYNFIVLIKSFKIFLKNCFIYYYLCILRFDKKKILILETSNGQ